jgi:subtilisin family serine protease
MIVIEANYSTLLFVAKHASIANVHPNFEFPVALEAPEEIAPHSDAPDAIEWNVNKVNAPAVWSLGFNGSGFVVAGADTGIQWDHPALKPHYRGLNSDGSANHNYNWWDAVHATGSKCGADSKVPCDDSGHGTHTVGTMVGADATGTNQIGVAPGATWIGCRNMNAGNGSPVLYIECLQFFVAPTDLSGKNPDPNKRPHVIGNSYGCPKSEGCVADSLQKAVDAVIAASIFMSVSAGNSGPSCSTVSDPPGTYANVFSVAALAYNSDAIASYSSRGPVPITGVLKPDISAPGSQVRSAYPTNTYASLSGTSMASPHITGIIPLLWQAKSDLVRNIPETIRVLRESSHPLASTTCGGNTTQNNVFGAGGVDVLAAVRQKI